RGGGLLSPGKTFLQTIASQGVGEIAAKVENEEPTINEDRNQASLKGRIKEHHHIMKHSVVTAPKEHVDILEGNVPVVTPAPMPTPMPEAETPDNISINKKEEELKKETVVLAQELNLNSSDLTNKFALQQKDLHNLIFKIRELHLKRLLCATKQEFESITEEITKETLAGLKAEATEWMLSSLNNLTKSAAEYKLKLTDSMQSIHIDNHLDNTKKWLTELIAKLSKP
ncbi:MAG: hypothetical protein ABIH50_00325, partial [bacterium]